jgi:hypothetical protein
MQRLLFGFLLLATASCTQDPAVPRLRDEIILRLTVSKAAIRPGDSDTLTVTATNNFGEQVRIDFPNACQVFAYIRDSRGRIVAPGRGWTCLPGRSTLLLAVNESRTYRFVWTGLSEFVGAVEPGALPAGEYFATATLEAGSFAVHAPPVRITLQP